MLMNSLTRVFGNSVLIARLPVQISFRIYCVVCGDSTIEFSVAIVGPSGDEIEELVILSNTPRQLSFRSLEIVPEAAASDTDLGATTIQELVIPTFTRTGIHSVIASINGREAARLPLLVRLPRP